MKRRRIHKTNRLVMLLGAGRIETVQCLRSLELFIFTRYTECINV